MNAKIQPQAGAGDLAGQVVFAPEQGRIWLGQERMVLLHASGIGVMRRELIETLGPEVARGLITRIGYNSGARDAELARRMRAAGGAYETFSAGPELHMLEGLVRVETTALEVDVETGHFYGEYLWFGSVEGEEQLRAYGVGPKPACWMQVGYASAFASTYMGRPVLCREVECCAKGDPHCRMIGRPVEDWEDAEDDLQYLRADEVTGGVARSRRSPAVAVMPPTPDATTSPLGDVEVVGVSAGFNAACHMVRRVADTRATVLFLGESGVGKEVLARGLHAASDRAGKPFVAINCAAIPDELIESELFGVEKGAFTGAQSSRPGRFERAQGGTLFLDEIGILSWTAQGKLLRALQQQEIERVGDTRVRRVDVRVVAATNLDLRQQVQEAKFREDLYYRLNVFPIRIPPLRERREDIPIFMNYFLHRFNERDRRDVRGFTAGAINALLAYDFPGNIRELENMIERGTILASAGGAIDVAHLFTGGEPLGTTSSPEVANGLTAAAAAAGDSDLAQCIQDLIEGAAGTSTLDDLEALLLERAVARCQGNLSAAARQLGITRPQLAYRLNKHSA